jgi:antitoxin component YwqK of YwqJK toxin-antitoxin module
MKKIKILTIAIISFNFCFSQNTEIKIKGDSIFKVTPNSIFANNYYLVCLPTEDNPKDLLRITKNEYNPKENKNLIWKKIKMVPGYEGFWIDIKKLASSYKNIELIKESTIDKLTWEDVNWSNYKIDSNEIFLVEKTNNIPNGKWVYKFKSEPNQTKSLINKEVYGTFNNGLANGFWDKYETIRKNNVVVKIHSHQNYNNGVPQGEWYTEEDGKITKTSFFLHGKAHGKWVFKDFEKEVEVKREMEFKDGFKDGKFYLYRDNQLFQSFEFYKGILNGAVLVYFTKDKTNYLSRKAQYKNGNPFGNWEFYSENGDLSYKILYKNSSEIAITLYDSKIQPMIEKVYFEDDEIIENSQCTNIYFPKNFSCNHRTTTYFKNGNVNSVCYYGTETFKMGKKFYKNYENGTIKSDGIYGQNISFFDTQGTLINKTNFDDKIAFGNENKDETGKDEIDRILNRHPFAK